MPIQNIVTTTGPLEYSASSSFGYRFSRYLVLPRIAETSEFRSGDPFQLSPIIQRIVNEYLTPEEQQSTYVRPNGRDESVIDSIRWFVRYVGREISAIEFVERGYYRMPTGEAPVAQANEEIEEELAEEPGAVTDGWLYAFTFPELQSQGKYPIKVGMTIRDVEERVNDQCRGSAIFSNPKILKSWPVCKALLSERTVHCLLKLSGQWKSDAPGSEWFITNIDELDRIVNLVISETRAN
jgi:T5orf172 domain